MRAPPALGPSLRIDYRDAIPFGRIGQHCVDVALWEVGVIFGKLNGKQTGNSRSAYLKPATTMADILAQLTSDHPVRVCRRPSPIMHDGDEKNDK